MKLNTITNSVKSASFSKVPKAIWDGCRLPMHSPSLSVVSLGGEQKFAALQTNDRKTDTLMDRVPPQIGDSLPSAAVFIRRAGQPLTEP